MPTLTAGPKPKRAVKRSVYPRLWTADEFLDWLQPKIYADLIGGQKYMHSPANFRHGTILNTVQWLLMGYIDAKQMGWVHRENIAVRFDARNVFMPDLIYFTNEQVGRLLPGYAQFAPMLVVEALSKATAKRDTGIKFAAYEQFGVQEYWVLDPMEGEHRFYAREGELLVEFAREAERIDAKSVPGFYLRRSWLDPVNPPSVTQCLREMVGEAEGGAQGG